MKTTRFAAESAAQAQSEAREKPETVREVLRELVMHLDGYDLNFCFQENDETNRLINRARKALGRSD